MGKKRKHQEWLDYVVIALAMMMGSVGLGVFLLPNHITMGGVGGIASILYWGFKIPVSVSYLIVNLALLAVALRILGWRFCAKTIYAVAVFAGRSEEHTSELQSRQYLVCRLLLEKKNTKSYTTELKSSHS